MNAKCFSYVWFGLIPTNSCNRKFTNRVCLCAMYLIEEVKFELDDSYNGEYKSQKDLSLLFSCASVILIKNFNIKFRWDEQNKFVFYLFLGSDLIVRAVSLDHGTTCQDPQFCQYSLDVELFLLVLISLLHYALNAFSPDPQWLELNPYDFVTVLFSVYFQFREAAVKSLA